MPAGLNPRRKHRVRTRFVALGLLTLGRVPLFPVESWKMRRMRDERQEVNQVAPHALRRPRSWNVSVKPYDLKASVIVPNCIPIGLWQCVCSMWLNTSFQAKLRYNLRERGNADPRCILPLVIKNCQDKKRTFSRRICKVRKCQGMTSQCSAHSSISSEWCPGYSDQQE